MSHFTKNFFFIVICLFGATLPIHAQISLTTLNSPLKENFNGMGATGTAYITNWTAIKYAGTSTTIPNGQVLSMATTNGSSNAGNIYNAGAASSSERAFGSLASGSVSPRFGASFINNTSVTVSHINLKGVTEQWRSGSSATVNEVITFEYSFDASNINDASATWKSLSSMDLAEKLTLATSAVAVNGNDTINQRGISGIITGISFNPNDTLWIRWSDSDALGSDGLYAVDDFEITLIGSAIDTTPPVLISVNPFVPSNGSTFETLSDSLSISFTEAIKKGSGNITVRNITDGTSQVINASTVFVHGNRVSFLPSLIIGKNYYVQIDSGAFRDFADNDFTGFSDDTTWTFSTVVDVFNQNFNTCSSSLSGGWQQYSEAGPQTWSCTTFGQTGNAVQINGFSGTSIENKDWLISPSLNLAEFSFPLLSFSSRTRFSGPSLKLFVSTNYIGSGDPSLATWTEINGRFPAGNSDVWTSSKDINLSAFKSAHTYIAFVYTSTSAAAARWTLDDYSVINSNTPPPPFLSTSFTPLSDFGFGISENLVPTSAKSFTFSASNLLSNLNVAASSGFELSKDSINYSPYLTYLISETELLTKVYVRFHPTVKSKQDFGGAVYFSSDLISAKAGFLTGSTNAKERTLDVVAWNIEWFGSPSLGPSDNVKQLENAKKVIQYIDADIYVLEEISNLTAFQDLVSQLPGYRGFASPYISFPADATSQRIAVLYKTSVVDSISAKGLLTGAEATGLPGYPGEANRFWASGRLPYLFEANATIDGISKRLHIIGIHAKANENSSPEEAEKAYNRRKYDVQVLKDSIDAYYPDANIIMVGDYNDDVDFTVANVASTASTYKSFADDTARYRIVTRTLSDEGLRTYITSDNVIDHIAISNELKEDYLENSAKVFIPFTLITNYENTTSDHMPVMSRFLFVNPNATINFANSATDIKEDEGSYVVNLVLNKPVKKDATVKIKVKNGIGVNYGFYGDYSTFPEVANNEILLKIPAQSAQASFAVVVNRDLWIYEPTERIDFSIDSLTSGLIKGTDTTFALNIENEIPRGIIGDIFNSLFTIYPSPTAGPVTLQYPSSIAVNDKVILIVASLSTKSYTFSGTPSSVNAQLNAALPSIKKGFYIVKLVSGQKVFFSKIIKN